MVQVPAPPPPSQPFPVIYSLLPNQYFYRIFDPTKRNATALTFRSYGPLQSGRFDHHRANLSKPSTDLERSIFYAGMTLECCLVEVFGDIGTIEIAEQYLACLGLQRDLHLLDLRSSTKAENAGTVQELTVVVARELTQSWSRYFYEHPEIYSSIDGIIHINRHNAEETVTLYERAIDGLKINWEMRLDDTRLRDAILFAAARNNLTVVP